MTQTDDNYSTFLYFGYLSFYGGYSNKSRNYKKNCEKKNVSESNRNPTACRYCPVLITENKKIRK